MRELIVALHVVGYLVLTLLTAAFIHAAHLRGRRANEFPLAPASGWALVFGLVWPLVWAVVLVCAVCEAWAWAARAVTRPIVRLVERLGAKLETCPRRGSK